MDKKLKTEKEIKEMEKDFTGKKELMENSEGGAKVSADKLHEPKNKESSLEHNMILQLMLNEIRPIDFRERAGLERANEKLKPKHFLISCIEEILDTAQKNNWGLCKNHSFIYLYNGTYWQLLDIEILQIFLSKAAEKMGVNKFDARYHVFQKDLLEQFLCQAYFPQPENSPGTVFINLRNGTFVIDGEKQELRPHSDKNFLTYKLNFDYDPSQQAPLFQAYLDKVLPDKNLQNILAEYLAYVLIPTNMLKLEKLLLLYGGGANGKSVLFDIVNALLGRENVSSYSLQHLTDPDRGGAYRAKIANKLVNYASEISAKLETSIFKAMVSGEPIEARPLYEQPFLIFNYAKLIFNCNELPKDVEHTLAFFRRFLIIPFDVTIQANEQDKSLSKKIIQEELSGIFNWVLEGLKRLLMQKGFTESDIVNKAAEDYKKESDNVLMFIEEKNYKSSDSVQVRLQDLYQEYRRYCNDYSRRACSDKTFSARLKTAGFDLKRKNSGMVVYIEKVEGEGSVESVAPNKFFLNGLTANHKKFLNGSVNQ